MSSHGCEGSLPETRRKDKNPVNYVCFEIFVYDEDYPDNDI